MVSLDLSTEMKRVRPDLRRRIKVHYPTHCIVDGEFVWNYVFREGAITWSKGAQQKQLQSLEDAVTGGLKAINYVVFLINEKGFTDSTFRPLMDEPLPVFRSPEFR